MNDYYDDGESNWILYLLIFIMGTIIVANIGVKIWQVSLERKYDIRYEEAKTLSNEYKEKYYSMEEALNSYFIKLEGVKNSAKMIVKQNIITIIVEVILFLMTFIPISFMRMIFKYNKKIAYFRPNRTTSIVLFIEVVICIITIIMNIKGSIEIIGLYQQICGLVEDMFNGLESIIDTINYQINQYR